MIICKETRAATLDNVRWLRDTLTRRLNECRIKAAGSKGVCQSGRLPLIDGVALSVAELANNIVLHADPPATSIMLTVWLSGSVLRVELLDDGGSFKDFEAHYQAAQNMKEPPLDQLSGRGLWLVAQNMQELEYRPGLTNRMVASRMLKRTRPHILLITENAGTEAAIRSALHGDYRIFSANFACEAVDLSHRHDIDAILTDVDKVESVKNVIKHGSFGNPVPVILLAAGDEIATMPTRNLFFVDQVLQTGFTPGSLMGTIEVAIAAYTRRLVYLAKYFGESAGQLHSDALPATLPGYRLVGSSGVASFGGGDFALTLEGDGFSRLVVADVMGHGIRAKGAGIGLASMIRTLHLRERGTPESLLQAVSTILGSEQTFSNLMATLIVVDFAPDGWISAASAGHPPLAVISNGGCLLLPGIGPLPGLINAPSYEIVRYKLAPGDRLSIITDGVDSETMATSMYPKELLAFLKGLHGADMKYAATRAKTWIESKLGPAPRDDWTFILAEHCPNEPAARFDKLLAS